MRKAFAMCVRQSDPLMHAKAKLNNNLPTSSSTDASSATLLALIRTVFFFILFFYFLFPLHLPDLYFCLEK